MYLEVPNVHESQIAAIRAILDHGKEITVRGATTLELSPFTMHIHDATDLFPLVTGRNANPFAQIAESLWVLAGRNDLDWLEDYIPQVKRWSDDGKTWRAGYGPRLRRWHGIDPEPKLTTTPPAYVEVSHNVDQIAEVVKLLKRDPDTRQAVITLWDPASDWVESKDIPCNNWLHFTIREGKLNVNIVLRSNDVIYGYSHADQFIWSVLHQLLASILEVEVGSMTWNATSFHLYERHYALAKLIVDSSGTTAQKMHRRPLTFPLVLEEFDKHVQEAFYLVDLLREDYATIAKLDHTKCSYVVEAVKALAMFLFWKDNKDDWNDEFMDELRGRLLDMHWTGMTTSCLAFFSRAGAL